KDTLGPWERTDLRVAARICSSLTVLGRAIGELVSNQLLTFRQPPLAPACARLMRPVRNSARRRSELCAKPPERTPGLMCQALAVPELPDVVVYIEALRKRTV